MCRSKLLASNREVEMCSAECCQKRGRQCSSNLHLCHGFQIGCVYFERRVQTRNDWIESLWRNPAKCGNCPQHHQEHSVGKVETPQMAGKRRNTIQLRSRPQFNTTPDSHLSEISTWLLKVRQRTFAGLVIIFVNFHYNYLRYVSILVDVFSFNHLSLILHMSA